MRLHGPYFSDFSNSCPAVQIEITVTRENSSELIKCIITWPCLKRTGNKQIPEFDWLTSTLTAV